MEKELSGCYFISINELRIMLEKAFNKGALSHNQWMGQPDTCWSNVNDDMKEEVLDIINEFLTEI